MIKHNQSIIDITIMCKKKKEKKRYLIIFKSCTKKWYMQRGDQLSISRFIIDVLRIEKILYVRYYSIGR